jgi:hypothetical protein
MVASRTSLEALAGGTLDRIVRHVRGYGHEMGSLTVVLRFLEQLNSGMLSNIGIICAGPVIQTPAMLVQKYSVMH